MTTSYRTSIKLMTDLPLTKDQKDHVLDLIRNAILEFADGTLNTEQDEENEVPEVRLVSVEMCGGLRKEKAQ